MSTKRRGLGRNLDVLLSTSLEQADDNKQYRVIPVDKVRRSPYQPRRDFEPTALEELAQSIRAQGVIQPIVVRKLVTGDFELVAGERRWRASQMAGLSEIPALIRDIPDHAVMAMALIENIQRENLNPIEEALALNRLIDEFKMTHQQAAEAVGKSRATVTNLLRLLSLQDDVKIMLEHGEIEMGHARALLAIDGHEQVALAKEVVEKGSSVRDTEKLIRKMQQPKEVIVKRAKDPDVKALETQLSELLGAAVALKYDQKGKGNLTIHYNNLDELDGILKRIK